MIHWEWTGKADDAQAWNFYSSGTGQSGAMALSTAADTVLTNAQSLKLTQQTSSGNGTCNSRLVLPGWIGYTKFRVTWVYRVDVVDANFYTLQFRCYDFNGTDGVSYSMQQNSGVGATEEMQYFNDSGVAVDTGFYYPEDKGLGDTAWHTIGFDVNAVDYEYTALYFDTQYDLAAKSAKSIAYAAETGVYLEQILVGNTTLSTIYIDSVTVDLLE